jgi:hypothetical protein
MRRELPLIVRARVVETIAQQTRPLEESMLESLMSVIRDSQEVVFRTYRDQSINSSRVPSDPNLEQRDPPSAPQPVAIGQSSQSQDLQEPDFLTRVAQPPPALAEDLFGDFALPSVEPNGSFPGSFYDSAVDSAMHGQDFQWLCSCVGPCSCFGTTISSTSRGLEGDNVNNSENINEEKAQPREDDFG